MLRFTQLAGVWYETLGDLSSVPAACETNYTIISLARLFFWIAIRTPVPNTQKISTSNYVDERENFKVRGLGTNYSSTTVRRLAPTSRRDPAISEGRDGHYPGHSISARPVA